MLPHLSHKCLTCLAMYIFAGGTAGGSHQTGGRSLLVVGRRRSGRSLGEVGSILSETRASMTSSGALKLK